MQEVARSIRVSSTFPGVSDPVGHTFGGLVAAEGCFSVGQRGQAFTRTGTPRLRFKFHVTMAAWDRALLIRFRAFLGCGALSDRPPAKPGWQPTVTLAVASEQEHLLVTIPFAERFLPPSHKRDQFEAWRDQLLAYRQHRPSQYGRGPSTCSEPGCEAPVRGRGKCRHHYYLETGY
jgi:hypothetical protein